MTDEEKNQKIKQAYEEQVAIGTGDTKPTYAGTYEQQMADLYNTIANRADFSYDLNGDALYQQYKDNYMQQGKMAMKDTMGQAAGLTGGYGSSYAQKVGQQQYDQSLQNLTDIIPELWNMAYQVYSDKGDQLNNQYSLLGDLRNNEYNQYQDALSNWNYDQETAYNKWTDAYNRTINEEQTAYDRSISEANTAYEKQQTAYSNLYALIGSTGYSPTDEELAAAGMSRGQANALIAEYQRQITPSSSGGGGSSSSSSSSSSTTSGSSIDVDALKSNDREVKVIEPYLDDESGTKYVTKTYNVNSQGETRLSDNMTRGEISRQATQDYLNGTITYAQMKEIQNALH